jgi:hypothetical protein
MTFSKRWSKRNMLSGHGPTLHDAIEDAAKGKPAGWYRLAEVKVEKTNPISDYHVILAPTSAPSP